jgi:hypothetical protein
MRIDTSVVLGRTHGCQDKHMDVVTTLISTLNYLPRYVKWRLVNMELVGIEV